MKRALTALVLVFTLSLTTVGQAILTEDISHGAPSGIVLTEDGGYLITDVFNKVVWKVDADGTVTRVAGQFSVPGVDGEPIGLLTDGTVLTAFFQNPWDITPFLTGYLVSEPDANVIRFFDSAAVQTAAGSGEAGYLDEFGIEAEFSRPTGLATGDAGEVYIADTDNGAIRRLDTDGNVVTICTGLSEPTGLCWYNGALYVAETGAHCISSIQNGTRTVIAGAAGEEGYTEGNALSARFRSPMDVAVADDGTIYIADTGNGAVRRLRDGIVSTLSHSSHTVSPVRPRSLAVAGNALLVTDPFAKDLFTLERQVFTDVASGAWYKNAVYAAVERGLFSGMGNHMFAPEASTNRAMLAKMMANIQQQLDRDLILTGSAALSDVSSDHWYSDTVRWAVDLGIMDAADGIFAPNRQITRQEMALALWKFAGVLGENTAIRSDLSRFTDADKIDDNAREAMSWALAAGLINGVSETELSPHTTTTRAQMVQVMIRFMDLLQK